MSCYTKKQQQRGFTVKSGTVWSPYMYVYIHNAGNTIFIMYPLMSLDKSDVSGLAERYASNVIVNVRKFGCKNLTF